MDSMTAYEVEFRAISEHRDPNAETPFAVDVAVHVQRAETGATVGDESSGAYDVTFTVTDDEATLSDVSADGPFNDLALVAIRAAADKLHESHDAFDVANPVAVAAEREYSVFDQLP